MENAKCLVELDEILKYLEDNDLKKIPYDIRKAISQRKDKQYKWKYDETKDLSQQKINRKTIAMLSYLNMEYLLDEEQKKLMQRIHKFNEDMIEKEKSKKYSADKIFKNNEVNVKEETELVTISSKKWHKKYLDIFRNWRDKFLLLFRNWMYK